MIYVNFAKSTKKYIIDSMGFLKTLFSGKVETPEEKKKVEESKNFDVLKYDGVKALRAGEAAHAVECSPMHLDCKRIWKCAIIFHRL